jgi:hypothetical protein
MAKVTTREALKIVTVLQGSKPHKIPTGVQYGLKQDDDTFSSPRHDLPLQQPVSFGEHRMMFRPRDSYDQKLLEAQVEITPEPSRLRWIHDAFGNCAAIAR